MRQKLRSSIDAAVRAVERLKGPEALAFLESVSILLAKSFREGNKVIIAGNGGSLCDAAHFAEELTGYFRRPRAALPVIALTEPGHLTCVSNDVGFDSVFARGVEAYGKEGDVFVGLSTSGNSPNIIKAVDLAKTLGLTTVTLLGPGGRLKGIADCELIIEGFSSSDRIQEAHMTALHILVEMVETLLFPELLSCVCSQ